MSKAITGMEIARIRIAREAEERSGFLNLGLLGLTELPEELYALQHLRCLNLGAGFSDKRSPTLLVTTNKTKNNLSEKQLERLTELPQLTALSVQGMPLASLSMVSELFALQRLDCAGTSVFDLSPLAGLNTLQELYCYGTQICDLSPLSKLTSLQTLHFSRTNVVDLSPLARLSILREIYFHLTQVSDLLPLAGLVALQVLDCSASKVSNLSPLSTLTSLQELHCVGNHLSDLSPLVGLVALQILACSYTQVHDLRPLAKLVALKKLDCSCTKITDLSPLKGLTSLQELLCNSINISDLSPLSGLTELQKLNCSHTAISDLSPLSGLTALQKLNFSGCRISYAPTDIWELPSLEELILFRTVLPDIPLEALSQDWHDDCLASLRAHLADLQAGAAEFTDVKLLILGNGRVGKTQFCRRLRGEPYDDSIPSTHGIVVSSAPLQGGINAKLNLWDFGGQDIYHGTHALFLRNRALFLLLWSPDSEVLGEHEYDGMLFRNFPLSYWLNYVRHLAGTDNPLLLVQTHCDRPEDETWRLPLSDVELQPFGYLKILHYSALNDRGRGALNEALLDAATWLQQCRGDTQIGVGRLRLLRRLQALRDADAQTAPAQRQYRTLSQAHYHALCQEAGDISAPELLLEFLHHCGMVFHRPGLFGDKIVLDQGWALEAVYAVFHREKSYRQLHRLHGRFSRSLLELLVWQEYNEDEQRLFLDMMLACGVCFEHRPGSERDGSETEYIAPDLLPDKTELAALLEEKWSATQAGLELLLHYPLLHDGLLSGLLARLGKLAGVNALYWKGGVCLYEQTTHSRALLEQLKEPDWSGYIRIATQYGQAAALLQKLLALLREEEQRWGLHGDGALTTETSLAGLMPDALAETEAPLFVQEPGPQPEYCVSYAWGDTTEEGRDREVIVDRLCQEAEARGIRIVRDKQALGIGDSITRFMQRIGYADRVFVILSDKYLKSPYCMFELWEIWRYSRQEPEDFLRRVRVYSLSDAAIFSPLDRAKHAVHWKQQHDGLHAMLQTHGADILGEADFKRFKLMQDFAHRVGDILAMLADIVQPRNFEDLLHYGLDEL